AQDGAATAGPLGRSLASFASQHGIALSFDPALTDGLQAPGLPAGLDVETAFSVLLAGSGLQAVQRADGSYTVLPAAAEVHQTAPLRVGAVPSSGMASPLRYGQGASLDDDALQAQVKGNGDIATVLRAYPSIQFSDTARSTRNGGEIRPQDISINGAPFYQNLFTLDGADINNDLDPAAGISQSGIQANHPADVPSAAQGVALDVDLLESLTVYDANVPAAYGGFTGGVIDARSRQAGDRFGGKLWMRMARSAWDQVVSNPAQADRYAESATYAYQPRYDKYKLGARLEGRLDSGLGLIGTFTRTRSDIPLRAYSGGDSPRGDDADSRTQTRQNTAASVALDWSDGTRLDLGANLAWAPTDDHYFIANTKHSGFDLKSGGPVVSLRATVRGDTWNLRNTLSYSDLETSRRSEVNYYRNWARSAEYDWGVRNSSAEGSWGDIDQHDRKLGYRVTAERVGFGLGASEHVLQMGLGVQRREADYERLNDQYNFQDPLSTTSCDLADGRVDIASCSLSPVFTSVTRGVVAGRGQYFSTLYLYSAGRFQVSGTEYEAWLQDDIAINRWSLRPGLRLDRSSLWTQATVAPRLAVSWDAFGDQRSVLDAGINRYYGRNFFNYLLREGREALRLQKSRTSSRIDWDDVEGTRATTSNRIADLDIPYTDEWTVGLDQRAAGLRFNLKYVDRQSRRDVLRRRVTDPLDTSLYNRNGTYEYVNSGRSRSRTWTLAISPQQSWLWLGTQTHWQLAADHTDTRRNYNSYESTEDGTDLVIYQGRVMHRYDLPATDYLRPWSARLSTRTEMPALGLSWSNFLRIRAGYQGTESAGTEVVDGVALPVLKREVYPSSWNWDTTLEYRLPLARAREAYARVEVQNVLNRSNRTSGASSTAYYEPGRSFWLELGYTF
ncbi:TonB-dependent receptor, partial [Xanthomonas sp. Kuri4-1]